MIECEICGKEYKNLFGLSKHIGKIHNVSSEEYYLKYLGEKRKCEFCGKETKFKNLVVGYQKYCGSMCCNNDLDKRKLVSDMRKDWWENSDKVNETKEKISNTVSNLWKDETSIYNTEDYRKNLSDGQSERWSVWREKNLNQLFNSYGYDLISSYENAHKLTTFKCTKCGYEFITVWNLLQSGKLCPKCFPGNISKAEKDIVEFIKTIITDEIIENSKQIISPKELDIYIPSKMIAIEYDGLWSHSEECEWGGKDKNYHLNKTLACEKQGIQLIHIFEDEWIFKKDIVKSRLKQILNINGSERIHARKCIIKEIDPKTKNEFLEQNHIQGKDNSVIKLGAFYNNELVSVMTFGHGNISKGSSSIEGVWELNRFCSYYNYHIPGIASKLLTHFKRNYEWKKIFSYADRRWSLGNLYSKLGFELEHITESNYWYIKNYKRIHRFSLRKREDEPKDISELTLRHAEGYNRIWDCGNYKFHMINKMEV